MCLCFKTKKNLSGKYFKPSSRALKYSENRRKSTKIGFFFLTSKDRSSAFYLFDRAKKKKLFSIYMMGHLIKPIGT